MEYGERESVLVQSLIKNRHSFFSSFSLSQWFQPSRVAAVMIMMMMMIIHFLLIQNISNRPFCSMSPLTSYSPLSLCVNIHPYSRERKCRSFFFKRTFKYVYIQRHVFDLHTYVIFFENPHSIDIILKGREVIHKTFLHQLSLAAHCRHVYSM